QLCREQVIAHDIGVAAKALVEAADKRERDLCVAARCRSGRDTRDIFGLVERERRIAALRFARDIDRARILISAEEKRDEAPAVRGEFELVVAFAQPMAILDVQAD